MPHWLLIIAAAAAAVGGQTAAAWGTSAWSFAAALGLFAIGGWALACADRGQPMRLDLGHPPRPSPALRRLRWTWVALAVALALAAVAVSRVSVLLSWVRLWCWLGSVAALAAFAMLADRGVGRAESLGGSRLGVAAELLAVAVLAFGWRLWRLDENPPLIWEDEIVYLLDALDIAGNGPFSPFASGGWGAPYLHAHTIAASAALVADRAVALRLVSAIPGALSVPLLWLTLRELFGRRFASFGAVLMAVAAWHTIHSRQGYVWAINPFAELIVLYGLARGMRRGRFVDFGVAGFGLGLGVFYSYSATLMPLVVVAFALYLAVAERAWLRARAGGLAFLVLASIVASGPRLTMLALDADARGYQEHTLLFNSKAEDPWEGVARQLGQIAVSFNRRADGNELFVPVANAPLLDPVTAAAFGIGFFWALLSLRQMGAFLLLATFGVLLLPSALGLSSTEWATAWRACGVAPAVFGLAAAPFAIASRGVRDRRAAGIVAAALALLVGTAAFINGHWYFVRHPAKAGWHSGSNAMRTRAAAAVLAAPPATRVIVNHDLDNFQVVGLVEGRRNYEPLTWPDDGILPDLWAGGVRDTLVLAAAKLNWEDDVAVGAVLPDLLEYYYPGGRRADERGADGRPLFSLYEISAPQIRAAHGLTDAGDGRFSGTLLVPEAGEYRFAVDGDPGARIRLDGRDAIGRRLLRGLHRLDVELSAPRPLRLAWGRDGTALERIPPANLLRREVPDWGFRERVLDASGGEIHRRWTPVLWFSAPGRPFGISPELAVEWTGEVEMPRPGAYQLLLMSSAVSSLWIDGEEKIGRVVAWPSWHRVTVDFSPGRHRLRILSEPPVDHRDLRLFWIDESGDPGLIGGTVGP